MVSNDGLGVTANTQAAESIHKLATLIAAALDSNIEDTPLAIAVGSNPTTVDEEIAEIIAGSDWMRGVRAAAWDEGFDAGERDAMGHVTFDEPCIPNPYRGF